MQNQTEEGALFKWIDRIGNLAMATVLWLIGCLPVVTIVTSGAALYYAAVKSVRHGEGYVTKEFWRAYKRCLKGGIPLGIVFLAVGAFLGLDIYGMWNSEDVTAILRLFGYAALLLVELAVLIFVCPALSRFTLGCWKILRLALTMVVRHPISALGLLLLWGGLTFLVLLVPVPFLLVLPGLGCYVTSLRMEKLLQKYMHKPESEEEKDMWYYKG